jgi:phosphoserine phosphatase RsbU/P
MNEACVSTTTKSSGCAIPSDASGEGVTIVLNSLSRLCEKTHELTEELRLARRLQMDFLPKRLPDMPGAAFAAHLEPASWVAGDFYDILRLDEQHIGFYVADAIGHGIAAALLTVFVKKSLQTKRIEGRRYELIPPDEAMALLNADLISAELQESPFITMAYAVYNTATRECDYTLAGHPQPLLMDRTGRLEPVDGGGPLLGIFADAAFTASRRVLEPGERLLIYSDGAERIDPGARQNTARFLDLVRAGAKAPADVMIASLLGAVRVAAPKDEDLVDDVTFVALDLETVGP